MICPIQSQSRAACISRRLPIQTKNCALASKAKTVFLHDPMDMLDRFCRRTSKPAMHRRFLFGVLSTSNMGRACPKKSSVASQVRQGKVGKNPCNKEVRLPGFDCDSNRSPGFRDKRFQSRRPASKGRPCTSTCIIGCGCFLLAEIPRGYLGPTESRIPDSFCLWHRGVFFGTFRSF